MLRDGSGSGSRSGSFQIMTDPDPKGPKTYGSGSATLVGTLSLLTRRLFSSVSDLHKVVLDPDPVAMKFTKMEKFL